jgi:hypothetical protein
MVAGNGGESCPREFANRYGYGRDSLWHPADVVEYVLDVRL